MKGKLRALQEGILAGNRAVRQMRKRGSTERLCAALPRLPVRLFLVDLGQLLSELVVSLVGDRLQPFVGSVFSRNLKCQMRKPAVGCRAMPVLYVGRNVDDIARAHLNGRLSFFLIPAFAVVMVATSSSFL